MISKMQSSTVFAAISHKGRQKDLEELQTAIVCDGYTISIYGEDTEEWKEAYANLGEKKLELSRHIELTLGFGGGLRAKLNNLEEDKIRTANKEARRKNRWESITYNSRRVRRRN